MYYDQLEEAQMRLGATVVMYDGRPVYVREVVGSPKKFVLRALALPGARAPIDIALEDPKLECRNLRLGYVNWVCNAHYVSRMPVRRYKQGLCGENVSIDIVSGIRPHWRDLYPGSEFADMLRGIYPSFDDACEILGSQNEKYGGEIKSVAFHKNFAISRDDLGLLFLYHKGNKVAWSQANDFVLPTEYSYLKEVLDQSGVKVA